MTQRDDYVDNLLTLRGLPYNQAGCRCDPFACHSTDCSGAVCWGSAKAGDSFGCTGSFALARAGHAAGTGASIAEAKATKGMWVFQGANEGQGALDGSKDGVWPGHIGTSLGNGQTFEARGHIAGVGVFDFDSLRWVWACRPPNMAGFDQVSSAIGSHPSNGITAVQPIDYVGIASDRQGGYWIARHNGQVYAYGDAHYHGGVLLVPPAAQVVGIASTPGDGYWLVASDGGVFSFGDAKFYGSMGGKKLNRPVVGMARTPSGNGYWLVAADGGIFNFGDAKFYGAMGGKPLNQPIVGITSTPTGKGYWLVARDGGIFSFGDAHFYGSMGGQHLNQPVVGMASLGTGYLEVARDGGIFDFGSPFYGSMGGVKLAAPVTGAAPTPSGKGYWLVASDGGLFNFGDAKFDGNPIGL